MGKPALEREQASAGGAGALGPHPDGGAKALNNFDGLAQGGSGFTFVGEVN